MPKVLDNLKEEILQNALRTIYEKDVDALSIRKIAKDCNIGMGTVYNYFPSKQDLLREVLKVHIVNVSNNIKAKMLGKSSKKEKAEQVYLILKSLFMRSDKKVIKNIASILLSYPIDEAEILAKEIKNFGRRLEELIKNEMEISDGIVAHIIVNTLVFFAHDSEYTFEQAWEKLEKLL